MSNPATITASPPLLIGQAAQIQAPSESVAQFRALLGNLSSALKSGTASFHEQGAEVAKPQGTLLEEAAVGINKAEIATKELEREVNKSTHALKQDLDLNGELPKAIIYQKFTGASYFMSVNLVGTKAADFSEEVSSVTKGR